MTPQLDVIAKDLLLAVGAVGARNARLWLAPEEPCRLRLRLLEQSTGRELLHQDLPAFAGDRPRALDVPGEEGPSLAPATKYVALVEDAASGDARGEMFFETAPDGLEDTPEEFALGVLSCHQPFRSNGQLSDQACRLIDRLTDCFRKHHVKRVLLLGDQIYTDLPEDCSLFERKHFELVAPPGREDLLACTAAEVRELLAARYRAFWSVDGFHRLQSSFPCFPMWDDHELVDNFGTKEEHGSKRYAAFREGAGRAFYDYQMSRLFSEPAPVYHYAFDYGPLTTFVMDLRSEKRRHGDVIEFYSERQFSALADWLDNSQAFPVAVLALSVPLVHVPELLATHAVRLLPEGGDEDDRWASPRAVKARARLVELLYEHRRRAPQQRLVLVGGDVHVGTAGKLHWDDLEGQVYQLVSSPVSNHQGRLIQALSGWLPRMIQSVSAWDSEHAANFELLTGSEGSHNPVTDLNAGIVSLHKGSDGYALRLRLVRPDGDGGVEIAFDSGSIAP